MTNDEQSGAFSANTYCVFLPKPPSAYDLDKFEWPIDPNSKDIVEDLLEHITFIHEMTHYTQFTGTLFGLDYSRTLTKAYYALTSGQSWTQSSFEESYSDETKELRGCLLDYSYFKHQITERPPLKNAPNPYKHEMRLMYLPDNVAGSPRILGFCDRVAEINKLGGIIQPRIFANSYFNEGIIYTDCNAAALFEGFALNAEIGYMISAFSELSNSLSFNEYFVAKMTNVPAIYRMAHEVYLFRSRLSVENMVPQLAALIDVALMYSPLTVHKIRPAARKNANSQTLFLTPFDTFIRACDAAVDVVPIRSNERSEVQRFQNDICHALDIPTTSEMTQMGLTHLASLGLTCETFTEHWMSAKRSIEPAPDYYLLSHFLSLKGRLAYGDAYFVGMHSPVVISTEMELKEDWITYVDIASNKPWDFGKREQFASVAIGAFVDEFIENRQVSQCPLKGGRPFNCWTPEYDSFCSVRSNDHTRYCPFPFLQNILGDMGSYHG